MRTASMILVGLAAAHANAMALAENNPERFDLKCHLQFNKETDESDEQHIRLDLRAMKFCSHKCEKVQEINGIDENNIFLFKSKIYDIEIIINRITGVMFYKSSPLYGNGPCVKLQFSGFPVKKF